MAFRKNDETFQTRVIRAGNDPKQWKCKSVVPPIALATTFQQPSPGVPNPYEYGRSANPTRNALEKCLATTENAKHALAYASGLAAMTNITHLLSAGDHVIAGDDLYGGTNRYFNKIASKFGLKTTFVDASNAENVEKAFQPNTKMVWIETPTNPLLKISDIQAITKIVKEHPGVFSVVDNTFLSSYFQRPLDLGADIVTHSCTKYLNGHTDAIMGAIMTNNDELEGRLRFLQNAIGGVPSPFDCYMVLRALKTLPLRMEKHQKNGFAVARFLESNPLVERVLHPGLPSHPQHEIAVRQSFGHSGMVTFFIKDGTLEKSKKFFDNLKIFTLAESLGGYESLAELPSIMTHASVSPEDRAKLGITDSLIRLSCGLENEQDLINDLDNAIKAAVI